ncbi:MotA/TolQ/ExbB proton channel family protein [Candidatus Omnitrophota bacterium]
MSLNVRKILLIVMLFLSVGIILQGVTFGADEAANLKPYIESLDQAKAGMTLWDMIKAGGIIMIILLVLSIVTVALVVYSYLTLKEKTLIPTDFADQVIEKLEDKNIRGVNRICADQDNIVSRIVLAGLSKKKRGDIFAKEAMENCGKKEIGDLWQSISYISDIAMVAPLIGLLGTVLGMIQAFNVIAFQTAVVKPLLLAGGVSKAMVTTAGGLIVAIPALLFYSYFRGRVVKISNKVENVSADVIKLVCELEQR